MLYTKLADKQKLRKLRKDTIKFSYIVHCKFHIPHPHLCTASKPKMYKTLGILWLTLTLHLTNIHNLLILISLYQRHPYKRLVPFTKMEIDWEKKLKKRILNWKLICGGSLIFLLPFPFCPFFNFLIHTLLSLIN